MEYIQKIDERHLYGDGIGKVELYDLSRCNMCEEGRAECVAKIAGICYGQESKYPERLYRQLVNENASTLEFVRTWPLFDIGTSLRNTEGKNFGDAMSQEAHKKNVATFLIKIPIPIARQVMRHRTFSYQELSRRYTTNRKVPFEFWMIDAGKDNARKYAVDNILTEVNNVCQRAYQHLLVLGVRPEVARVALPLSLYTQFWMQGDVLALRNYFDLRTNPHTQREHRELAEAMIDLLQEHQPELWKKVKP